MLVLAIPVAFLIRFDGNIPSEYTYKTESLFILGIAIIVKILAVIMFRPFLSIWRKVSYYDSRNLILTTLFASLMWTFCVYIFFESRLPRSILILDFGLSLAFLFSVRFIRRYMYEYTRTLSNKLSGTANNRNVRTLLIGGGEAASQLIREIRRHPECGIDLVGILDDDPIKYRKRLHNIPIKGPVSDISYWVDELAVNEVIVAVANRERDLHRRALRLTSNLQRPLKFRTVPALVDLISNNVRVDRIRDVDVQDLLGRDSIELDVTSIRTLISNQVVLVTGAGGSIGSELVRQVVRYLPKKIILLGRGESSIYLIEQEIKENYPEVDLEIALCNIQNRYRTESVFKKHEPKIVLHAAAHKHVPLVELNPSEAVFNNVIGTKHLVELALKYRVSNFVNISTDKAVNPTSIMGASKHIAEAIVFEASKASQNTFFVSVRFGNVLGSRGSVIPLFKKQIRMGGPVTVTHPEMIRYFMTIPEAAQLVLQAASFQEQGMLYVLDMGDPVNIYDLAKDLIRLSGLEVGKDIEITFSGVRPGEKLYEELSMVSEKKIRTGNQKIFKVGKSSINDLEQIVSNLKQLAIRGDDLKIRGLLNKEIVGADIFFEDYIGEK